MLGELLDEVGEEDEALREKIVSFRAALPERLGILRRRAVTVPPPDKVPVKFDPELEKEIRAALGTVR